MQEQKLKEGIYNSRRSKVIVFGHTKCEKVTLGANAKDEDMAELERLGARRKSGPIQHVK
jgi:hypothetical protein